MPALQGEGSGVSGEDGETVADYASLDLRGQEHLGRMQAVVAATKQVAVRSVTKDKTQSDDSGTKPSGRRYV